MSEKYKIRDPDAIYFVTFTVLNWLKVFSDPVITNIVIESLIFCQQKKGLIIHAWCVMPNHIHLIISRTGEQQLSDIIRDFRRYTSVRITSELEKLSDNPAAPKFLAAFKNAARKSSNHDKYKVWKKNYHPIELDTEKIFNQKLDYIHNNPVAADLVHDPVDYPWCSAKDYFSKAKGPIEICYI